MPTSSSQKKTKKKSEIQVVNPPKKPVNYLNNKDLLAEVIKSKEQNKMTNELARMLTLLTVRYSSKGNLAGYTYVDDMRAYAMLMLCKTWNSFNPEKSKNPFAFFTQCVKNSFRQYLNNEKKQRDIRDQLLVDIGLTPSHRFQLDHQTGGLHEKGFLTDHYENDDDEF